jgi:hypothetical protein
VLKAPVVKSIMISFHISFFSGNIVRHFIKYN